MTSGGTLYSDREVERKKTCSTQGMAIITAHSHQSPDSKPVVQQTLTLGEDASKESPLRKLRIC